MNNKQPNMKYFLSAILHRYGLLIVLLLFVINVKADVRPAGIFSSDMVLQRARDIVVWGLADKGERVSITFNKITKKTKPDAAGKWKLVFPPMPAGGPYEMKVQGRNLIIFGNILIGDVWICSGQSNMGMTVKSSNDAEKEITAANFPSIRLMHVPRNMPVTPVDDIKSAVWKTCSPENIPNFSAVAYFFGRDVYKEIN